MLYSLLSVSLAGCLESVESAEKACQKATKSEKVEMALLAWGWGGGTIVKPLLVPGLSKEFQNWTISY